MCQTLELQLVVLSRKEVERFGYGKYLGIGGC